MYTNTQIVPTDRVLEVVADQRRRAVLEHLMESGDGVAPVADLVDAAVAADAGSGCSAPADVERVRVELQHRHLPRLAGVGVIDYDARSATVRYRPDDGVEELLGFVSDRLE